MNVAEMAVTLFAVNRGFMDDVDVKRVLAFEGALQSFLKGKYQPP
jgi:F-type H+-transporting ATPase subunit alpha